MRLNYHRAGHGEPLVLIHGIGSQWQVWAPVLDRLEAERDVVALDLPGFADSPSPPPGTPALSPAGFHTPAERVYQVAFLWTAVRLARLLAPSGDRLLARPRLRAAALGGFIARPQRVPAPDAAASLRALADAPWFDESLPAIGRDHFDGGEQIAVPVTIAWGDHDRLLLPHQAKRAARQIPSARIVVLRGCGHVPTYDDPEQVAQVLLEGSGDGV